MSIPFSILDLAPIGEGQSVADAIQNSKALAQCAEANGYQRVWLAEHHGMRGIASAATAVMLGAIGEATSKIRIGSGGVMLPNHAPLVIAEQFGTLAEMFPGRVDLGLGRAPGTDMATARALRRNLGGPVDTYADDVEELQGYLADENKIKPIMAMPGQGTNIPIWLLGSSLYSAQLAAHMGLPFSFASHFAPDMLLEALNVYRANFRPSEQLDKPYVSAGVMASVAETDEEAKYHFTSAQIKFAHLRRNANRPFPKPVADLQSAVAAAEMPMINQTLRYAMVGSPTTVEHRLAQFIELTDVDEIIISFPLHDPQVRLQAVELMAGASLMAKQA
ncbi:LLM class flavin-dependent oxidoreductase [Marinomonas ostreistagni]|uniref:LLM class flavin-dependent oxidoreductase n=1 Tax=Marinomonas ostreistagni TaxID=359209 RepID=A0ABS0ZET0_9GAMM|nr:LLM class flavin-dependent oxidoreductase [Marinomonas ostreistagni]MBJ7552181.1 LLM class flavin-dependent oxidoreductase [Marinomonas ostreistagni]